MTVKKALFLSLAIFVLAVSAYFTLRNGQVQGAAALGASPAQAQTADKSVAGKDKKVIAYYFHVTVRCDTCRRIETYSKESIEKNFTKELRDGTLQWRPVNVQLPENRHFIQDYQLYTRSLVLARFQGGEQKEYKVLERTWDLVSSTTSFEKYVKDEVRTFLERL